MRLKVILALVRMEDGLIFRLLHGYITCLKANVLKMVL